MGKLRINFSVVSAPLAILQIEVASSQVTDCLTTIQILLHVIEVSKQYNGFTIATEEALVPKTDEEHPFASGCYLKFESSADAIKFLDSIDPSI